MKKIFILPILIVPIMAHATDPIGPAHVNSGAVVATASAPYATATEQTGDTTTVVSASYVKGAYNDAIAAVNKVNSDKQAKLLNASNNHNIESKVVAGSSVNGYVVNALPYAADTDHNTAKSSIATDLGVQNMDDALISAGVVLDGLHAMGIAKQDKLENNESGDAMHSYVISKDYLNGASFTNTNNFNTWYNYIDDDTEGLDNTLMSADGVITLLKTATDEIQGLADSKRVRAVTTWGQDSNTSLIPFANAQ